MSTSCPAVIGLVSLLALGCSRPDAATSEPARTFADDTPESQARAAVPASPRRRIVFLGDSLTAGYGLAKAESVPSLIQARLDATGYSYEVVNAGVSGDTSAGGLSRLDWSLDGDVALL